MIRALLALLQNRSIQHLLFWGLSFFILVQYFKVSAWVQRIDVIYTAAFHLSLLLNVYGNILWGIPRFLAKGQYVLYGIFTVLLLVISAQLNVWLFDSWIDYIFPGYYFIAYYRFEDMLVFQLVYAFLSTLLKLSKGWFQLHQLTRDNTKNELKALKSQINPHFFFNSLNSIYALALEKSAKAPEIILKLGDIMRYVLYQTDAERIALRKEIDFIQNFVDLQRIRIAEDAVEIRLDIQGEPADKQIAPLIFLPLLENSFKHGLMGEVSTAFVHILLEIRDDALFFRISNNRGESDEAPHLEKFKGIGLENIRQRLRLIYPFAHQLTILPEEKRFTVELLIRHLL